MNELKWMEQGNLQDEMSNYKMSKMEEGNSLTPPPHGYLYYKNPPTEKKLSKSQKQKTQKERDDVSKQMNHDKSKPVNKTNPPDPKPLKPITKEEKNEGDKVEKKDKGEKEYHTRKKQGLTFGGKKRRKSRKQRRRTNKNKKRKSKRKYIKHCK